MGTNGNQWGPKEANGGQWEPMGANGPTGAKGRQWEPMGTIRIRVRGRGGVPIRALLRIRISVRNYSL